MEWRSEVRDGAVIVGPKGSIDHQNADSFESQLLAEVDGAVAKGKRLIIDLKDVGYMSSLGLRILVRAQKAAKAGSLSLSVANLSQMMAEIFKISRFDQIIRIHDTVEEALQGETGS